MRFQVFNAPYLLTHFSPVSPFYTPSKRQKKTVWIPLECTEVKNNQYHPWKQFFWLFKVFWKMNVLINFLILVDNVRKVLYCTFLKQILLCESYKFLKGIQHSLWKYLFVTSSRKRWRQNFINLRSLLISWKTYWYFNCPL